MNEKNHKIKDPGSAITHFIALLTAALAALPLLLKASERTDPIYFFSLTIFIVSMILLYGASTAYHTFDISENINLNLKKLDHSMISVMIAGSYTPVCLIVLHNHIGVIMLTVVWSIALAGIIIKLFWVTCPKWFSSILYIGMGWTCVIGFSNILHALTPAAFGWLLAGGIIYTIGGVIYALKLPLFDLKHKNFGTHEIFHLFVMGGSVCHFILMYNYVVSL